MHWIITRRKYFSGYLFKNPGKLPSLLKFMFSQLHAGLSLHFHLEAFVELERTSMKGEILQIRGLVEGVKARREVIDLKWLEENQDSFGCRWSLLYLLLRILKPALVVETGVGAGESTTYVLQALADNKKGFLHSIDLPNQFYITDEGEFHSDFAVPLLKQPGYLVPAELGGRWKLHLGNSWQVLPRLLRQLGEIDLFLHDSEHTYETMRFEYESAWPHIRPGGYLVSDDVLWSAAFSEFFQQQGLQPTVIEGVGFVRKPKI